MFRNYLATALRNLARNRLYAAINVVGLAIGFAAALFIGLFVRDELTHDTWVPHHENIYRVAMVGQMRANAVVYADGMHPSNAGMLKDSIPEIVRAARLMPETHGVRGAAFEANDTVIWADAEFLEMFPVPALSGDPVSGLRQADQIVLTKSFALKYFGRENVVGETLEIDRKLPLRVAAVIADFPSRSHLNIGALASGASSASPYTKTPCCNLSIDGALTYVELQLGAQAAVTAQFPGVIDQYIPGDKFGPGGEFRKASTAYAFELTPLAHLHMLPWSGRYIPTHHGVLRTHSEPALVPALLMTGALILLVSVVNVFGLMSARAGRRLTEVGVRKVSGALRIQLVLQFIGETTIYAALSMALALLAATFAMPGVNAFLGRTLAIDIGDPQIVAGVLILVAVAAIVGSLHPAVVLSRIMPVKALKPGRADQVSAGRLRYASVLGQFAILIVMIIAVTAIDRQTRFAMTDGLRFDTDQLLVIDPPCDTNFKEKIAAVPGVRGIACAGPGFLTGSEAVGLQVLPDGGEFPLNFVGVDAGFMEMIGVEPLAGRLFSEGQNASVLMLNETAARAFGHVNLEEAIGKPLVGDRTVIGVVPDFALRSLRDAPMPTAFVGTRNTARTPSISVVKLAGGQVPEALRAIDAAWDTLGTGRPTPRRFYDQVVQAQYTDLLRQSQAFQALSFTAIVLAALGLFGLAAFSAERRTKEIGIRKSMGATSADIVRLMLWEFLKPVLLANVIAWPAAYIIVKGWLDGFAYRIDLTPWIFLTASGAALVIAFATVIGHTLLVARARPVSALRYE